MIFIAAGVGMGGGGAAATAGVIARPNVAELLPEEEHLLRPLFFMPIAPQAAAAAITTEVLTEEELPRDPHWSSRTRRVHESVKAKVTNIVSAVNTQATFRPVGTYVASSTYTGSTSLTVLSGSSLNLVASTTYFIHGMFFLSPDAISPGGFQIDLGGGTFTAVTMQVVATYLEYGTSVSFSKAAVISATTVSFGFDGTANPAVVELKGPILVNTSGTLVPRVALNTVGAATHIKVPSFLTATKVG